MILFPPCKINLGLYVTAKREDGFHDLQTVFFQLPWCDVLEIVPSESFELKVSGLEVKGDERDNLCYRAYDLLRKNHGIPPVYIHLHKIIPMGAGLGGGSADGTYTLMGLNDLFDLKLSKELLLKYALALGSDCPLFLEKFAQYAEGRGEQLQKIDVSLSGYWIRLVNIGVHVSTREAFSTVNYASCPDLKAVLQKPISDWRNELENAFELPVFKMHPELERLKNNLFENGALYVSMTGTGSTVFAIHEKKPELMFAKDLNIIEKLIHIE